MASGAASVVASVTLLPRDLDGYVVAVPTNLHAQVIGQLLDRDRPIFVEKPMTDDPEAAERLADKAGERIFVMHKWCYHGGIEALARLVQSRELGQVRSVQSVRCQCGQPHDDVNATWILMPHDLSIVLHVLGHLPPVRAAYGEGVDGSLEGVVAFLGEGAGTQAIVQVSALWPGYSRMVRVLFEDGIASMMDPMDDHIVIHRFENGRLSPERHEHRKVDTEMPLLKELGAFVNYLNGGPRPYSSAAEGAAIVRAIANIHRMAGFS